MKNKILLLCTLTLCSALFSTVYSAFGAGGDLLWEKTEQLVVGEEAKAASIITVYDRVIVAGSGVTASGKAWWVRAYTLTGALAWEHIVEKGEAVAVDTGRNVVYATGSITNAAGNTDLLLVAYEARTGAILWSDQVDSGGDDKGVDIGVPASGDKVAVGGQTGTAMFVRTYKVTGDILWTRELQGQYNISSVHLDDYVFVCGSVGSGPNADWFLRQYKHSTGQLRVEYVTDIAGGEDHCLSTTGPGGEVWTAGFATLPTGDTDYIVRTYTTPSNSLILNDQVGTVGKDDKALALTYQRNRGGVTGFETKDNDERDVLVKVYDLVHRKLLWEDRQDPSEGGDDEGTAATVSDKRLFIGGHAGPHPLVMAYRWSLPKTLFWQTINSQRIGTVNSITLLGKTVFVAGSVKNASGVDQFWVAAYDGF